MISYGHFLAHIITYLRNVNGNNRSLNKIFVRKLQSMAALHKGHKMLAFSR